MKQGKLSQSQIDSTTMLHTQVFGIFYVLLLSRKIEGGKRKMTGFGWINACVMAVLLMVAGCEAKQEEGLEKTPSAEPVEITGHTLYYETMDRSHEGRRLFALTRKNMPDFGTASKRLGLVGLFCPLSHGEPSTYYFSCDDTDASSCVDHLNGDLGRGVPASEIMTGREYYANCLGGSALDLVQYDIEGRRYSLRYSEDFYTRLCLRFDEEDEKEIWWLHIKLRDTYGLPIVHHEMSRREYTLYFRRMESFWGRVDRDLILDIIESVEPEFKFAPDDKIKPVGTCLGDSL